MSEPFTVDHFCGWARDLELDNGEPWVVQDFFALFLEDYFAGIPENWLLVPEGNSKTTGLGGLAVYLLEFRPNPAIPWAASSRDQAEIGYRQAEGFVLRSSRLKAFLKPQDGYRRIKNTRNGGRLQVFAADDKTGDGIIPTDAFLDELHRHRDLRLYRTWRGKLEKRGGQMAAISTAGEPGSEFEDVREEIRRSTPIVEQRPGFVRCRSSQISLHEYAVPEGSDIDDMAVVKLANPFDKITEESLAKKRTSPTMTVPHWRRFVCNLATRSVEAAVSEAEWERARVDVSEWPARVPCWAGLDLGWQHDTTALVPLYVRGPEFRLFGEATILEPLGDGTMLDPHLVENAIIGLHARNPIATLVMDTSHGAQLASWIESELGIPVVARQQTNPLAALDYAAFMEALREGWLHHVGDVGLSRHVLNATTRLLPGGGARFDRPHQSRLGPEQRRRVIDGLSAASMVHGVASAQPPKYRTAGFH